MSEFRVSQRSVAPIEPEEVDLLACLYHEIGLSAVAAALEVLKTPAPSPQTANEIFGGHNLEALHEESLAA
jgi:hypothetical protein